MTNRLLLAAVALVVSSALPVAAQTIEEAQAQMRATLAIVKQERAAKAEKAKAAAAAAAPKHAAQLSCHDKNNTAEGFTGVLDLDTMKLETSRAPASRPTSESDPANVVDDRCGSLVASLAETYTYAVTPVHYWGQDLLQLPKSAAQCTGKAFEAQLHTCQYDGEWHADSDAVLVCTLTAK